MPFQKRCSHLITRGCPCNQNSGVTSSCLSYAEAKAALPDFPKAPSLTHPSSRGDGGGQFRTLHRLHKAGREGRPDHTAAGVSACCMFVAGTQASKQGHGHGWAAAGQQRGSQKGRRSPARLHYSHCQKGEARMGNLAAPVDRETDRPGWEQWDKYWR